MPKRQKPSGQEKWTWEEIQLGHKLSKTDRRWRKLAQNMGATKRPDGTIQPPKNNPEYYMFFGGLLLLAIIIAIFSGR